jgi:hypothetical protein
MFELLLGDKIRMGDLASIFSNKYCALLRSAIMGVAEDSVVEGAVSLVVLALLVFLAGDVLGLAAVVEAEFLVAVGVVGAGVDLKERPMPTRGELLRRCGSLVVEVAKMLLTLLLIRPPLLLWSVPCRKAVEAVGILVFQGE